MDKVSLNTCYCILNFYPDNILVNILRTLNLFSLSFLTLRLFYYQSILYASFITSYFQNYVLLFIPPLFLLLA